MRFFKPAWPATVGVICLASQLLLTSRVLADVPGLQIAPLQYQDTLHPGQIKNGFVDVSNPGDSTVEIISNVQGFKQIDSRGALGFFDDADLANAIKPALTDFTLGPREAIRVSFSVDPGKLPAGGIYAAIFFRTVPPGQTTATSSYIDQSAKVGTLLMLTNGPDTTHYGKVTKLDVPFWQFGYGISGLLDYRNTDRTTHPIGFRPSLKVRVLPWGHAPTLTTGLVLPGVTRNFPIVRTGAYFGLLPVMVTDSDTHLTTTAWVFACTGWYAWATILVVVFGVIYFLIRLSRRKSIIPIKLKKLFRLRRKKTAKKIVAMDGLRRKS